jgi:hypothetical protein
MIRQDEIIKEVRRIATKLRTNNLTAEEFDQHGRIESSTVTDEFGSWDRALQAAALDAGSPSSRVIVRRRKVTDDEIRAEMRRVADELETTGLTERQYKQLGQIGIATILNRFGSWNQAVQTAGLDAKPRSSKADRGKVTEKDVVKEIRRVAYELHADTLTQREFRQYGRFSLSVVVGKFGSWDSAVQAAFIDSGPVEPQAEEGHKRFTEDEIIEEIRRVAAIEQTTKLTQRQFREHGRIGCSTVKNRFGSWNQAVQAAGLDADSLETA